MALQKAFDQFLIEEISYKKSRGLPNCQTVKIALDKERSI
jgi:hypothetical protein